MSVTPVSDTPESSQGASQGPRQRPHGLTPIIMSGWVTPSPANDDIENPVKKLVCDLPYHQKCETFIDTDVTDVTDVTPFRVKLFDTEAERVREARETCAMEASILKRY